VVLPQRLDTVKAPDDGSTADFGMPGDWS
jgi:hypothetical protein